MIEEKDLAAETAAPTGDADKDKRMKKLFVPSLCLPRCRFREIRFQSYELTLRPFWLCPTGSRTRSTSSRRTSIVASTGRRLSTRLECRSRLPRFVPFPLLFLSMVFLSSLRDLCRLLLSSSLAHLQRRCANCGAVGHMKTNRKCPKWAEFNLAPQTVPTATGVAGLPLGGMGDFGAGLYVVFFSFLSLLTRGAR